MLDGLTLRNYRGFEDHELPLRPLSIIVGRNNAGKSTVVEALRLISVVTQRLSGLNFRNPPAWTGLPRYARGVSPSIAGLGINLDAICHRYADPPAIVIAHFTTGETIEFRVNSDGQGFAVLHDSNDTVVRAKGHLLQLNFPTLHILPQVAPLEQEEVILTVDYVRRNLSSPLAPRHFRNQLRLLPSEYRRFRRLAEESWPGLQIRTLDGARGLPGDELYLAVRDGDFVAEVSRMGHGLQMWLQTIWFLSRTPGHASVVLDEPDVYMHSDLQRRMVRLVKDRFTQVIIATHSVEIMAEVEPAEILVIDRKRSRSDFASSEPAVQSLIDRIGGIHNIHLARLWDAHRCLFLEGDDLQYLRILHDLLFPTSDTPLDNIPNTPIGGWTGWPYAVGSSLFIRNAFGANISVYCILDSDYHTQAQIQDRYDDAAAKNVRLHIWSHKELENYFLVPDVIMRTIAERMPGPSKAPNSADIAARMNSIADELRDATQDAYADAFLADDRRAGITNANRKARYVIERSFRTRQGKLGVVSGKEVLSRLTTWAQAQFGVSFGSMAVLRHMRSDEVPEEVGRVLEAIENQEAFVPP